MASHTLKFHQKAFFDTFWCMYVWVSLCPSLSRWKREAVFFFFFFRTSQQWCSVPLIHISLNFCKTRPGMKEWIKEQFRLVSFISLQVDMFLFIPRRSALHLWVQPLSETKKYHCFSGKLYIRCDRLIKLKSSFFLLSRCTKLKEWGQEKGKENGWKVCWYWIRDNKKVKESGMSQRRGQWNT